MCTNISQIFSLMDLGWNKDELIKPFCSGLWVSSMDLGDEYATYMESFGHNSLTSSVMSYFMKEIHEYKFFVEELRIKVQGNYSQISNVACFRTFLTVLQTFLCVVCLSLIVLD